MKTDRYHPYAIGLTTENKWKSFFLEDAGRGQNLRLLIWLQHPTEAQRNSLEPCLLHDAALSSPLNFSVLPVRTYWGGPDCSLEAKTITLDGELLDVKL